MLKGYLRLTLKGLIMFGICLTMVSGKPGKLRVLFDSSSRFKGVALNNLLLKGPDLNNSLIGVLLCFRKNVVDISCDIKQMFYHFHVADGFKDLKKKICVVL